MVAIPANPLHCARPFASTLAAGDIPADIGCAANGFPMLQRTGGDITVIGAILNVPIAVN